MDTISFYFEKFELSVVACLNTNILICEKASCLVNSVEILTMVSLQKNEIKSQVGYFSEEERKGDVSDFGGNQTTKHFVLGDKRV